MIMSAALVRRAPALCGRPGYQQPVNGLRNLFQAYWQRYESADAFSFLGVFRQRHEQHPNLGSLESRHARQCNSIGFSRRKFHAGNQNLGSGGSLKRIPRRERVGESRHIVSIPSQEYRQFIDNLRVIVNHDDARRHLNSPSVQRIRYSAIA
jgi:hypothetical protein